MLIAPPARNCGTITQITPDGKPGIILPLEGTEVKAKATGLAARVEVTQTFKNPSKTPIEAIYTFPLPSDAAVDRMVMTIGDRVIEGEIKRREEARAIYDAAKAAGQTTSLLDQERPNVFTQSIANLMPGKEVKVQISYVEKLKFEDGQFEFSFPMVVGPRFNPASTPDPGAVTPPVMPPQTRTGADINLDLEIESSVPIVQHKSILHATKIEREGDGMTVSLSRRDEIPNRDFIFRWSTSGDAVQEGVAYHADGLGGGYFAVTLLPPKEPRATQIQAKEVIFVMDQSGSQRGFPIDKSKELTRKLIKTLSPGDTFNVVSFSNSAQSLWPNAQPVTEANQQAADRYVAGLQANGGTQFAPAVEMAYGFQNDPERLRLVVFNTDAYVGNDFEVLELIQRHASKGRMFTFGIGNSVNRFLIDSMSAEGRGDSEIVTLAEQADAAVDRFIQRTENPVLTDVEVAFRGGSVSQVTPNVVPDVFSDQPIVIFGRYRRAGQTQMTIEGSLGGEPYSRTVNLNMPEAGADNQAIASLWARHTIGDLMRQRWRDMTLQVNNDPEQPTTEDPIRDQIITLALNHRLMSQFTSFVAVEKKVVNVGGKQRTVRVPVDRADGVQMLEPDQSLGLRYSAKRAAPATANVTGGGRVRGGGGGYGGSPATKPAAEVADSRAGSSAPAEMKLASSLKKAKGKVEIQIRLKDLSAKTLEALKKAGFKLEDSDKGLKVAFGTADAKKLMEIAKLESVLAIDPI